MSPLVLTAPEVPEALLEQERLAFLWLRCRVLNVPLRNSACVAGTSSTVLLVLKEAGALKAEVDFPIQHHL